MTLGSHVAFFYFLSSQKRFMYLRAVIVSLYIGLHLLLWGHISLLPFNCSSDDGFKSSHHFAAPTLPILFHWSVCLRWMTQVGGVWLAQTRAGRQPSSVRPPYNGKSGVVDCVFLILLQWALSSSPISTFSSPYLWPHQTEFPLSSLYVTCTLLPPGFYTCCSLYLQHTLLSLQAPLLYRCISSRLSPTCSHSNLDTTSSQSLPWL